jgi:hypothetical protein
MLYRMNVVLEGYYLMNSVPDKCCIWWNNIHQVHHSSDTTFIRYNIHPIQHSSGTTFIRYNIHQVISFIKYNIHPIQHS